MMKKYKIIQFGICLFFLCSYISGFAQSNLPTPSDFLGYELGDQYTPHWKVFEYFKTIADNSPQVSYEKYGQTNEGRELGVVYVSSEENQSRIEQIRTDNLKRAGMLDGTPSSDAVAIVWLSYNVHGNEASSSEAAMKTLYALANPSNNEVQSWLKNTVVIIDPMLNPDGRDRYVNWYNQMEGTNPNVNLDAREHHEPWPSGRVNHYYFDLNRDWAWLTQVEVQQRIKLYQKWLPQVHVDFHEQGINENYFFPPAAKPYHERITKWQREFEKMIGDNNAKHFDQEGWLYFNKERFDLLYPSYGDTYPIYNGAIAMTYEQAGNREGGRGVLINNGDTLTLKDRLLHHYTTSLSTVEVTSNNAAKVVDEFEKFYTNSASRPAGKYKSYIIKSNSDSEEKIDDLLSLLDKHNIEYGHADKELNGKGYDYQSKNIKNFKINRNDIIIDMNQPKSVLAGILFEPKTMVEDSLTYDVTAWSLPYAYGLEAYASESKVENSTFTKENSTPSEVRKGAYAYLMKWAYYKDAGVLSKLLQKGVVVRFAKKPFSFDGKDFGRGTVVITNEDNKKNIKNLSELLQKVSNEFGKEFVAVSGSTPEKGPNLGSNSSFTPISKGPNIALLSGETTSVDDVGHIWHFFDKQIRYPITLVDSDYFDEVDLDSYDVIIIPSAGREGELLGNERLKKLDQWVSSGGNLIVIGTSNKYFAEDKDYKLSFKGGHYTDSLMIRDRFQHPYKDAQRVPISYSTSGTIFKVTLDSSHPLAFGYKESYPSLKLGAVNPPVYELKDGWSVGIIGEGGLLAGSVGYKARKKIENSLDFGVEPHGRGTVVYMIDNPLFRAFWNNGKLLFSNAVFYVGNSR